MHCRICGSELNNDPVVAREMMIPTREEFAYFECPYCHCLQIGTVPENLYEYYGPGYYSFQETEEGDASLETSREGITDQKNKDSEISGISNNMSPILDVGCGAGKFLKELRSIGYANLTGCDPFIDHDLFYGNEIKIFKKTIHEIDGEYDKIFLNDSFEHVTDPHEVMESIHRLLAPDGMARIALPVYPNVAYDMFGADWYQLDAPRHIFIHSRESMAYLAKQHGLRIVDVTYDSDPSQIFRSYLYSKDIPFWEQTMRMIIEDLGEAEVNEIAAISKEANEKGVGDHAVFCLVKA